MAAARSAVRSPWRLSKRLASDSLKERNSTSSSPPTSTRPTFPIQRAGFTTCIKLQKVETPASNEGNKEAIAATSDQELVTPQAEVDNLIGGLHNPDRPQDKIKLDIVNLAKRRGIPIPATFEDPTDPTDHRLPRNVQALFLAPMRRQPTYGIPVCNLQIRSFSARNLEYMADFAMRAAYYLDLPAKGPVPLPRITNRWTVPRSNFVHTKTPENFERVTLRRLIQIQDGHPDSVRRWLQFVRKHTWYGVGYKADVFDFESVDSVERMDTNEEAVNEGIESIDWNLFGRRQGLASEEDVAKALDSLGFSETASTSAPAETEAPTLSAKSQQSNGKAKSSPSKSKETS